MITRCTSATGRGPAAPDLTDVIIMNDNGASAADLLALPPTIPVKDASKILGIGRNRTYDLIKAGLYPIRVLDMAGRFKVSRHDLLIYLGVIAPPASDGQAAGS